jgi:hypothetical protein
MGQTFADRQRGLQRWSFKCTCDLCSADADATLASDTRRMKIASKREKAIKAYQDGNAQRAIELLNEVLALMHEEDLPLLTGEIFENLGRVYWAGGDREKGQRYARMSLETMAEQGYISRVRPGHLRALLRDYERDRSTGETRAG